MSRVDFDNFLFWRRTFNHSGFALALIWIFAFSLGILGGGVGEGRNAGDD